jgi:hypothetical protein
LLILSGVRKNCLISGRSITVQVHKKGDKTDCVFTAFHGIYLRMNIPVADGEEFKLTIGKIYAEYWKPKGPPSFFT